MLHSDDVSNLVDFGTTFERNYEKIKIKLPEMV